MGKHRTTKRRKAFQKKVKRYQKDREDLQLAGRIACTSEGAVRDERVAPASQGSQQLPALVREALRQNWATPDAAKPAIVGQLLEPFFACDVVLDKDGNQVRVPPNRGMLIALAKTLKDLDVVQHERDHPELKRAGEVSVEVNNQVSVIGDLAALLERAKAQRDGKAVSQGASHEQPRAEQADIRHGRRGDQASAGADVPADRQRPAAPGQRDQDRGQAR